jgi:hypothetical protein
MIWEFSWKARLNSKCLLRIGIPLATTPCPQQHLTEKSEYLNGAEEFLDHSNQLKRVDRSTLQQMLSVGEEFRIICEIQFFYQIEDRTQMLRWQQSKIQNEENSTFFAYLI